jgi:putative nucleotidyltransferase-like protein
MERELARALLAPLQLSASAHDVQAIRRLGPGNWRRILAWLNDSGLALYFLRSLQNEGATGVLPPQVLAHLEGSLAQNRVRWESIVETFSCINEAFRQAGVRFAVIKGLSLVPDYCPDEVLRAPTDLDYLVDEQCLSLAEAVLEGAGYILQQCSDIEFKYRKRVSRMPRMSDSPYSVTTHPLVELHLRFWKHGENNVPFAEPLFALEATTPHESWGLRFAVLNDCDAFLFQMIHIFQHTLDGWVKLCWLFEVGSFLSKRSEDSEFWRQVNDRIQAVPYLAEFAAIVVELARTVFSAPLPELVRNWVSCLRPSSRLWLDNYGETFAFDDHPVSGGRYFPTSKLSLFLHQEYIPNAEMRNEMIRRRLFPWKRPARVAFPGEQEKASSAAAIQLQWRFVLNRIIFHSGSTLRYLWEIPRWRKIQSDTQPHPAS